MADRLLGDGPKRGSNRASWLGRLAERLIPEWQVFIRRRDGRSEHFTFGRPHQVGVLMLIAGLAVWAGVATLMLTRRPAEVAAKERRLEAEMVAYRTAEHRLNSAHKLVTRVTREVASVHDDLRVLAATSAALAGKTHHAQKARSEDKRAAKAERKRTASAVPEPSYDDSDQPGGKEARTVRDEVRKLEASLDQLHQTYSRAVRNTADLADERVARVEDLVDGLGLDAGRLIAEHERRGQGGPFIPLTAAQRDGGGLHDLMNRMDEWSAAKVALKWLPLADPLHAPLEVNSPFGPRLDPVNGRMGFHPGVDLGAPYGTPVYATGTGIVKKAGPFDTYGLVVEIDHGGGIMTRYAHLSRVLVRVGQKVTRFTVIGRLGDTGRSTGPHLHYEVRVGDVPRDPVKFISAGGDVPEVR